MSDTISATFLPEGIKIHPLVGKKPICEWRTCDHVKANCWFQEPTGFGIQLEGLTVVDFDSLDAMQKYGHFIDELKDITACVDTYRGAHFYFLGELENPRNKAGEYDILVGGGHYVVGPHSTVLQDGEVFKYTLHTDTLPLPIDHPVAKKFLDRLLHDAEQSIYKNLPSKNNYKELLKDKVNVIREGSRNNEIHSMGCSMLARGFNNAAIRTALMAHNIESCIPPLDDDEMLTIINSVIKKRDK